MRVRMALPVALWVFAGACGKTTVHPTITFGVVLPYSGPASAIAPPAEAGVRAAVKFINDRGGLLGRDLAVQTADAYDWAVEEAQAELLRQRYQVPVIIGMLDVQSAPVPPWAAQSQMVVVTPYTQAPQHDFVYGMFMTSPVQPIALDLVAHGVEKTVILTPIPGFPPVLARYLAPLDANATVQQVIYPLLDDYTNWQDAGRYVAQALSSNPDAVFIGNVNDGGAADGALIFNALKQQNFNGIIYFGSSALTPPAGIGLQAAQGVRMFNTYDNPLSSSEYQAFVAAYEAWDNGNRPASGTGLESIGFDATMWAAMAVVAAGTPDGPAIDAAMRSVFDPSGTEVQTDDWATAVRLLSRQEHIHWHGATTAYQLPAHSALVTPYAAFVCCDANGYFTPDRIFQANELGN